MTTRDKRPVIVLNGSVRPTTNVSNNTERSKRRARRMLLSPVIAVLLLVALAIFSRVISNEKNDLTNAPTKPTFPSPTQVVATETLEENSAIKVNPQPNTTVLATPITEDNYLNSVVQVRVYFRSELCGSGSGTAVLDGSKILTNVHVIAPTDDCNVDDIQIWRSDKEDAAPRLAFTAEVISTDEKADLALLQISPANSSVYPLSPVQMGQKTSIGEALTIVGFPAIGGDSITLSRGIIAGYSKIENVQWIKTDATISGGSSGGGAFNNLGQLVAVPTMASQSDDGQIVDCRTVEDSNKDGVIDRRDSCTPIGGFLNLLSPIGRAPLLAATKSLR